MGKWDMTIGKKGRYNVHSLPLGLNRQYDKMIKSFAAFRNLTYCFMNEIEFIIGVGMCDSENASGV